MMLSANGSKLHKHNKGIENPKKGRLWFVASKASKPAPNGGMIYRELKEHRNECVSVCNYLATPWRKPMLWRLDLRRAIVCDTSRCVGQLFLEIRDFSGHCSLTTVLCFNLEVLHTQSFFIPSPPSEGACGQRAVDMDTQGTYRASRYVARNRVEGREMVGHRSYL